MGPGIHLANKDSSLFLYSFPFYKCQDKEVFKQSFFFLNRILLCCHYESIDTCSPLEGNRAFIQMELYLHCKYHIGVILFSTFIWCHNHPPEAEHHIWNQFFLKVFRKSAMKLHIPVSGAKGTHFHRCSWAFGPRFRSHFLRSKLTCWKCCSSLGTNLILKFWVVEVGVLEQCVCLAFGLYKTIQCSMNEPINSSVSGHIWGRLSRWFVLKWHRRSARVKINKWYEIIRSCNIYQKEFCSKIWVNGACGKPK